MSTAPLFRLEREIGAGATGTVWLATLARDLVPLPAGTAVAVKYLHERLAGVESARDRFEAEARAGSAVTGPGIVRVLARGADSRGSWIVMPYVPGETLRAEIVRAAGPLPEPLVRSIVLQLARGLAALHAAGFAHGDVKPENVRLDADGRAVLLDLGFARAVEDRDTRHVAMRPGSLPYLSPEQARGELVVPASDVFALGVVAWELATGEHPFARRVQRAGGDERQRHPLLDRSGSSGTVARTALEAPDADQLLAAIATARYTPPSRLVPQVSPFLDRLLADVLQPDAARRPDAAELVRRLEGQEASAWWRSEVDLASSPRRGGRAEGDAVHLTPFVGRESDLRTLLGAWDLARSERRPRAAWIVGPAGSGKSRLVTELATRARTSVEPPLVLYGRCRELDGERPCGPIMRVLERYLRLPPDVAPGERDAAELAALVPPAALRTLLAALDPSSRADVPGSLPAALGDWLAALARRTPLVVHLDDVHWAGDDTLDAVAHAASDRGGARCLFVFGQRDEGAVRAPHALQRLHERFGPDGEIEVRIAPLDEPAVEELVRRTFHHSAPRLRLAHVLWQRSRGNAGLLTEILRGMLARNEAHPHADGGGLVLTIDPDDLPLPSSLRRAIVDAYKRLDASDRSWLRRLSVVGGRIETDFLLLAFPESKRTEVDAVLGRLVKSGWLATSGARYRFARPALREAVYRGLSRDQRQRLHAAAARALGSASGAAGTIEDEFQRAFHLRAAGQHAALIETLPALLPRLLRSGQPQRVHPLASWGLEAIEKLGRSPERDRLRIELLEAAADAADRLGMRADQRTLLDQLADLTIDPTVDPRSVGRVYMLHARYALSTGQYGLARGMLRNCVELFERAGAGLELSESLRRLALVQSHVGEMAEATKLAGRALDAATTDTQRALAHIALGTVDLLEDRMEPALEHADQALDVLRKDAANGRPGVHSAAHLLRARIYRSTGQPGRAIGSASRAVRLARVAGERRLEAEATARLGQFLLDVDRPEEAEARLREALRIAEEIEDRRGQALARTFLGIWMWEADDPDAGRTLDLAAQLAEEMGLNRLLALVAAVSSRIDLLQQHDHQKALASSARAEDLLAQFGGEAADRIVITGTRVLVLSHAGLADEARARERSLEDRIARHASRIRSPLLRLRTSRASERLLQAVLSPSGPIYPRVALDG